ncbi:MAG: signal peptidase II [Clostridia bacterium]|nr:signal peptidase II [Clostridia bacterium]
MEFKIGKLKITLGWKTLICFIVLLALLGIDLGTKAIQSHYELVFNVIPGKIWVEDVYYNFGVSFGWLEDKLWLIETLTTILVVALLIIFMIVPNRMPLLKLSVAFVIAGALGNLIDRFISGGGVRDFIHDELITHTVLNMADLFITAGVIMLILDMLFFNEWSVLPLTPNARAIQKAKKDAEAEKAMNLTPDEPEEGERTKEDVLNDFLKSPDDVSQDVESYSEENRNPDCDDGTDRDGKDESGEVRL